MMRDDPETEGEIVWEKGAGWYVGTHRTSGAVGTNLQRLCLITNSGSTGIADEGTFKRFKLSMDGFMILQNPDYMPRIIKAFRERIKKDERNKKRREARATGSKPKSRSPRGTRNG